VTRQTRKNAPVGALDVSADPNLLRVLAKLSAGTAIKVAFIGDSGIEGNTVTVPGTDDAASRFCAALTSRFGVTVTKSNRAVGGHTPQYAMDPSLFSPTRFALALTDAADLYVISYGHNDIRSDLVSSAYLPGTGYPLAASRAAIEHMVRRIRIDVPEADIIISSEWPYTGGSAGNNPTLSAHGNMLRRIAAQYGCAFVDYYQYLVGLGVGAGREDTYVWPTGAVGTNASGQHPNDAGHAAWADVLLSTLPKVATVPPAPGAPALRSPAFGADRYTQAGWQQAVLFTGAIVPARWRVGGTWTSTTTTPTTSSTAASFVEVQAVGTEIVLRLDTGAGQGTVKVEVDGAVYNASLDLATVGTGQMRLPITGLAPGAHRVVVTVISGSLTFRGALYLPCIGQRIPYNSALITYTGTWTTTAADSTVFDRFAQASTTINDTAAVSFIGTSLTVSALLYNVATIIGVVIDGGTETFQDWTTGGTAAQHGGRTIVSGLPYGRHTVTLRITSTSGSRALSISNFFAYDETRTTRPTRLAGLGVAGGSIDYGNSLATTPLVALSADDATSTVPPAATSSTAAGFTISGTASSRHQWVAEGARSAY
jgi:lysophospholipase L1-like esterase